MKVLVIEDDVKVSAALRRALEAESYLVETQSDGDAGLWAATEGRHDVIVLDVMLPGKDGYSVCAELRRKGCMTPVLMLTALTTDGDQTRGLDTGADDYLGKPFALSVFLARVRALARRAADTPPPPVEVGALRIDPRRRSVRFANRPVAVTAREYDVLEYLVRRSGAVVSKRDILGGVWDFDFDGDPNIVEVYVRRLRVKLAALGAGQVIETVRGAGYRLVDHGT